MSLDNPLDNWRFLLGKWRGESKDKYGGKGVIVTIAAFTEQPSDKFIMGCEQLLRTWTRWDIH